MIPNVTRKILLTSTILLNMILMAHAKEPISVSNYEDLINVHGGLLANNGSIIIDDAIIINNNINISKFSEVHFSKNGRFIINNNSRLVINGRIYTEKQKIFYGSGNVSLQQDVYPEWWGASPDGTTDSTKAIENAIKSIDSGRSAVILSPGTYKVSDKISVSGKDIKIVGENSIIKRQNKIKDTASTIFSIINADNIHISKLTLDGGYSGKSTGSSPVIQVGIGGTPNMFNKNITIENNKIINGNHACIGVYGETNTGTYGNVDINILNNYLEKAGSAVFVYKSARNIRIIGNTVKQFGSAAIVLDTRAETDKNISNSFPISDVIIENNKITDVIADPGFQPRGITLKGAIFNIIVKNNVISNVLAQDNTPRPTFGILIAKSYGLGANASANVQVIDGKVANVTITNNGNNYNTVPHLVFSSDSGSGASADAFIDGGKVIKIKIKNQGDGYRDAPSLKIIPGEVGSNISIYGNFIENVSDNGMGGTTGWPVYVQTGFTNIDIKNNVMKNCKRGLQVDAADNVTIEGNEINNCPNSDKRISSIRVNGLSETALSSNISIINNRIINDSLANKHPIQTSNIKNLKSTNNVTLDR